MQQTIYVPESEALDMNNTYTLQIIDANGEANTMERIEPDDFPCNGLFLILETTCYDTPKRFFRIDFENRGMYVPILRNNRYEINITGINGYGYDTIEEAIQSTTSANKRNLTPSSQLSCELKIKPIY